MSQPHIQTMGAFDPMQAFCQTFININELFDGLDKDPQAIPSAEIIRATVVAADLLGAITEMTTDTILRSLARFMDNETYEAARIEYIDTKAARTPEQEHEYKLSLMHKVAQYIPHEVDLPPQEGTN